jgi:hypothetical protein
VTRHEQALLEFRRAEAFFRAQPSEWTRPQLVAAAVGLLTAGVDHESVAALAGDDTAEWREVQRDLDRAVQGLALSPLSESDAVRLSLAEIVTDIQDGRLDVWEGLDRIQRIRTMAPAEAVGDEQHELGAMAVEYLSERGQPFGYNEADIVPSLAWYLERAGSRDIYQR